MSTGTTERITTGGVAAAYVDSLIESMAHRRGVHRVDLSRLSDELRIAIQASLNMKAGSNGILKTNIGGGDMRISIKSVGGTVYELQVVIGCPSERPIPMH